MVDINNDIYDYEKAVKDDIYDYIDGNIEYIQEWIEQQTNVDIDDLREELHKEMWISDSVTGNGSGSYTFSTWKAECCLCHNMGLLGEALNYFDDDANILLIGAEACDVTIRCYLLGELLDEVIEENFKEQFIAMIEENRRTKEEC